MGCLAWVDSVVLLLLRQIHAPVAVSAASSAFTALLVGHPADIGVAWRVVGQFLPSRLRPPVWCAHSAYALVAVVSRYWFFHWH